MRWPRWRWRKTREDRLTLETDLSVDECVARIEQRMSLFWAPKSLDLESPERATFDLRFGGRPRGIGTPSARGTITALPEDGTRVSFRVAPVGLEVFGLAGIGGSIGMVFVGTSLWSLFSGGSLPVGFLIASFVWLVIVLIVVSPDNDMIEQQSRRCVGFFATLLRARNATSADGEARISLDAELSG